MQGRCHRCFLGYVIKGGQVRTCPEKISAVADWPIPYSHKKLQHTYRQQKRLNSRQARWSLFFGWFNCTLTYQLPLQIPGWPWYHIGLDFVTGLPPSNGHTVVLTILDRFSKAVHFIALPKIPTASETSKLLVKLFSCRPCL